MQGHSTNTLPEVYVDLSAYICTFSFNVGKWNYRFPSGPGVKNPPANARDASNLSLIDTWVGKISWRRKLQPTLYLAWEPAIDRGTWWATVHGITKELDMTF